MNAGGGTVIVPRGNFLSGPIEIGNSTNLQLASGAVLEMLPRASYPSPPPAFITTTGGATHDIAITGSGTIDGQGQDWWDAFAADASVTRPQEVNLGKVTRVQISGLTLTSSPEEHVWVKGDTDVTITGITISTLAKAGKSPPKNTDGVDVTATGMFFCNNNVADGDDNIAMGGTNLYIGYSTFGVGHGCSIGSITENGVSHVTVDHLSMNGTTSGIRMKSARDRGGTVTDLTYSNVTMTNVATPIYVTSYYPTLPDRPQDRYGDGGHGDDSHLAEHHNQECDGDRRHTGGDPLGTARGEDREHQSRKRHDRGRPAACRSSTPPGSSSRTTRASRPSRAPPLPLTTPPSRG